jgi:hypothetical protein
MRYEELPPDAPTLMESTRAIGYSIETAIADIIDNSITARARVIEVKAIPGKQPYFSIYDDGFGMSEKRLIEAMQYGSSNPCDARDTFDLGRYGLGLKTASLSQCRILTVLSKERGGVLHGVQWNLNHIHVAKTWSLIVLNEEEMKTIPSYDRVHEADHGTLVVWQDLDKIGVGKTDVLGALNKKLPTIKEHLSLVFHRFLSGEPGLQKIEIKVNNEPLSALDPFLIKKSTQVMDEERLSVRNAPVVVTPFILPHISKLSREELEQLGGKEGLRKSQGFYVYRNKRLLVWGTWFRLLRHGEISKLARIRVDIPNTLDDLWTLDIKKSIAIPPEDVRKNLVKIVEKVSESSKRPWHYRGKKETDDKSIHVWNRLVSRRDDSIIYEINRAHPLVGLLIEKNPEIERQLNHLLDEISRELPLNSIFVDLTSDRKMGNDSDNDLGEMIEHLKNILLSISNIDERRHLLSALVMSEPYVALRSEILEKLNKEGIL